jgi:hypothetical protein
MISMQAIGSAIFLFKQTGRIPCSWCCWLPIASPFSVVAGFFSLWELLNVLYGYVAAAAAVRATAGGGEKEYQRSTRGGRGGGGGGSCPSRVNISGLAAEGAG